MTQKVPSLKLNVDAIIPAIGFGTWQLSEGREVIESTAEALRIGYRLVDTAKIYHNEPGVGEAIRASGVPWEEVFVTTKLWNGDQGYDSAIQAFDDSLERLGLDYLDLYLIHWPGNNPERRRQSWEALSELYNEGRAKSVGVSNYEVPHLQELMNDSALEPAVNQIEFHPFNYLEQLPIVDFCKQNDIVVEAYSPLAMGRQIDNPAITDIAEEAGRTNAQVMLRWAIQHGTVPIPRSHNPKHIRSNFDVFDFELSEAQMETLNNLS